jgi:Ca2+-transporting ATPase
MMHIVLQVRVIRGGREFSVSTYDLLVGDLLVVETGDIIPADGVLVEGENLRWAWGDTAGARRMLQWCSG